MGNPLRQSNRGGGLAGGLSAPAPLQPFGLASNIRTAELHLATAAEIVALNAAPRVIIPAPAATEMICAVWANMAARKVGSGWTTNPTCSLVYTGDTNAVVSLGTNFTTIDNPHTDSVSSFAAQVVHSLPGSFNCYGVGMSIRSAAVPNAGGQEGAMRIRVLYYLATIIPL